MEVVPKTKQNKKIYSDQQCIGLECIMHLLMPIIQSLL